MYSSSPQSCHYYNNTGKQESSLHQPHLRYNHNNPSSNGGIQGTSDTSPTTPTSWHHMEHDYNMGSPTPSSTSPPFSLQPVSSSAPTPFILSHTSNGPQGDNHTVLGTPTSNPTSPPPPLLPSYGYGLSHRGFFPRPKLTTTLWEDERTICFQVDANGICVARREDNDMINGTKLLNVAGMSRGKRDGILKNEKGRVVVKVGAMHLKGVWITFDRAKTLSAQFKIQDVLYPLFVDNPQTFLYSHPITNPMSRLGPFRSFYPSSWDRSTAAPPSAQHTMESPFNARHDMAAPFPYRPGTSPEGPPTSNYGVGNHDTVSMDYRSNGPSSDTLADQHHQHQHHSPIDGSSPSHDSSYYNNLLDPNPHRSNDMPFYDNASGNNRETGKLMVSTSSSPESNSNNQSHSSALNNHSPSFLLDGNKRTSTSSGIHQPLSAFQSIDGTSFHHPQPLYMDPMNTTNSNSSGHPHYLANPLSANSNHSNNSSILNGTSPSGITPTSLESIDNHTVDNPPPSSSSSISSPSSLSSLSSSRRDSLVMMNHYPRNGSTQRHHPYANSIAPPKLSSMQDYLHHSHPHHLGAPDSNNNDTNLRKPSITTRLHPYSSRPLTKELDDLSVKSEVDHLSRPW